MTYLLFLVLSPLLEWLRARMLEVMADADSMQTGEVLPLPQPESLGEIVQEFALLRYCIAATILFIALIVLVIFFGRVVRRARSSEAEDTSTEAGLRPGGLSFGLDRLKDWFALLGRYGVSSQLLAAISVENIYANLARIARRKGFPRHPSQGPDRYLPQLIVAFEGHEAELNAITAAYIRVRYAERPITPEELDALRAAYASVTAPPEKPAGEHSAT
jgi:hypothetical protein